MSAADRGDGPWRWPGVPCGGVVAGALVVVHFGAQVGERGPQRGKRRVDAGPFAGGFAALPADGGALAGGEGGDADADGVGHEADDSAVMLRTTPDI